MATLARLAGTLALLGALAVTACGSAPAPPPASARIALDAGLASLPPPMLAEIDRAAHDADVLALGEGDHYVEEKYAYRLAFLRRLVLEHGVVHIGLEMGASDAARIDRFLETGDERSLRRVVLHGFSGESALERRELRPVSGAPRRPCDDAWAEAERRFFRTLRAIGEEARGRGGERVHVFGFDYDATPGGGYADARDALATCEDGSRGAALRGSFSPTPGTAGGDEPARLEALVRSLEEHRAALASECGAASVDAARDALSQLAFSWKTFFAWRAAAHDESSEAPLRLHAMFAAREARMVEQVQRWRRSLRGGSKIVLLAHDMHVARASETLRYGRGAGARPMWTSLGTALARDAKLRTWVVWLLYGSGSRYAPANPECRSEVHVRDGSLESSLDAIPGDHAVLVERMPHGSVVDEDVPFGTETSEGSGAVRAAVDVIVFLRRATAPSPR